MGRKSSNRGDVRQSALWGSGNRGGEHRSSALWGKGGRGIATTVVALSLALPLAASAESGTGSLGSSHGASYVSSGLKQKAKTHPNELISVIVMSDSGTADAEKATKLLGKLQQRLGLIDGVAVELRAREIDKLGRMSGLVITENAPIQAQALSSSQLWPYENGVTKLWNGPKAPAIAIVDSGIDASRSDFLGRVQLAKSFVTTGLNASGDGRGHGTFVAGIAAGAGTGFAGASPSSDIISLDVLSDNGSGRTSDVIAAAQWIYENHRAYNIRVANFSLHSAGTAHFYNDPLNRAVEKLWFDGVVVVAAVGNYGSAAGPSGVRHAPGNDPFVISVGAADIGGTARLNDDRQAPWSAYGYTREGFMKPEICAAGRYMVGPVPMTSTLALEKADKIQKLGYIELSGTSFAAPVVAGVAAQLLARSPGLSPDQVKGSLMRRAKPVPLAAPGSCGVGQVNAVKVAFDASKTANPNAGLNRFVSSASNGSGMAFDAVSWNEAILAGVSWNEVSWNEVSWAESAWNVVSWNEVSWNEVSWNEVSWNEVSWSESSQEDAAEGDLGDGDGYELTPGEAAAAAADPDLLAPGETLPAVITATALLTSTLP
ncbi:MAG TPA: S8 family serine peptidase [Plantibacter sp.]|uniref:S8 family serine peptidase n=1 Tax=Plantibacter sp. TaxID=1871045 RepID=UPI002C1E40D4|nr:S8 family serine peptidase [Plantibacter sp.]